MKILHVITSLYTGGAEKLMVDLMPIFQKKGLDVTLLIFDGAETPFKKKFLQSGIRLIELGKNRSVYSIKNLISLIPIIKDYDIIHCHNTAPQLFCAIASLSGRSILCTTEHNTTNRRRGICFLSWIDKWMYSRYRKIICISPQTEEALRSSIGSYGNKITTIYNGIDVKSFEKAVPANLNKTAFNCTTSIVQVAAFRPQKDQDTVIRSLTHLPEDFHLYLVGNGERHNEIIELINSLNLQSRVHLLGVRSDVPEILKAADFVVMSSHWEGFGLAAVEGMAAGKPVIASDVSGLREVVKDAGILFQAGDENELAKAILNLADSKDLYNSVARKCHDRALQFDISKMADGYIAVYNSLMNNVN